MAKSFKKKDPFYEREKKKYSDPLPSREYIIEVLEEENTPLSPSRLLSCLGLKKTQLEGLDRRLRAMERDGQLHCNRKGCYGLLNKLELVTGTIQAHKDGFGFLITDDDLSDVFMPMRQMRGVFDGDRVVVRIMRTNARGRREGAVVEVLSHAIHHIVGKLLFERGIYFVSPDSRRIPQDILIGPDDLGRAEPGQFVSVELLHQAHPHKPVHGRVHEVLGDEFTIGMEIELALRSHDIPFEWSKAAQKQAKGYKDKIPKAELARRCDLRELPMITIDGEDAKDFDDAVFCEREESGDWRVVVAIADVSHYVKPGTAIDVEASERGNSVYFPARVIPMLPEVLSNGLCSLNPHVDRLAMVADMTLSRGGELLDSQFYEAVIHSHARKTYTDVNTFIKTGASADDDVTDNILDCYEVYQLLLKQRKLRGAIELDTIETRIVFGDDGKIDDIVPVVRNDAHRLIEELMLLANKAAAEFLLEDDVPVLFRNHDVPDETKLTALRDFIKVFGLRLSGGVEPTTLDYARLLERIHKRDDSHLLQTVLLRSLKQAKFEPECYGHFGLAYDAYCQFTSPIRRYPDLIVHRAIKHSLSTERKKTYPYQEEQMVELGEHYSTTERRADKAVRDSVDWLKCFYMKDKVGEQYHGVISDVTSFGFFVQLDGIYVDGLVHIATLDNDYYHYDDTHHLLRGKQGGKCYQLGDAVEVVVSRVDVDNRRMDFDLVGQERAPAKSKSKSKSKPRAKKRCRRKSR